MIHFNSPEHIKQRQEVKPLTLEEMKMLINYMNYNMHYSYNILAQRLIWEYENYKHAYMSSRNVTEDIEVIYTVESKDNKDE